MFLLDLIKFGEELAEEHKMEFAGIDVKTKVGTDGGIRITLRFWTPHQLYAEVHGKRHQFDVGWNKPIMKTIIERQIEQHFARYHSDE